jgi:hypothetical protein
MNATDGAAYFASAVTGAHIIPDIFIPKMTRAFWRQNILSTSLEVLRPLYILDPILKLDAPPLYILNPVL